MKILHTSDWHIGKRLMDRERLKEQEQSLDEIAEICDREGVDLVLVAGDVFDTFTPPAEAEEVFYRKIKKIAGTRRVVIIVSGNHDDGVRLAASAPFASEGGVYLFSNRPKELSTGGEREVKVIEAGDFYAVVENASGERVYVNALPYPNEASLKEEKTEESYCEKLARRILRGEAGYRGGPYILLSHLFVAGGRVSDGERDIDLGGARAVPTGVFPERAFVALGHLHRKQQCGKNVFYSGSPLQYSFDEANTEKCVLLLETAGDEVRLVREIPLRAGKRLVRLESNGVQEALALIKNYGDCFVELTLNLDAPLTNTQTQALREACEGLVSIIPRIRSQETLSTVRRSELSDEELFLEYYRGQYAQEAPRELLEAFLALLGGEL